GGLAASFGGVSSSASSLFGARQTGNLLTKASWWCGGLFLALSFFLSMATTRQRAPRSVLDQAFPTAPVTAPAPTPPNTAVPLEPVPNTKAPAGTGTKAPTSSAPATGSKAPATKTP
ncbi:MAG: preprotein translocase subunit SecG, partial [Gemmatimonadaceae bacterium]